MWRLPHPHSPLNFRSNFWLKGFSDGATFCEKVRIFSSKGDKENDRLPDYPDPSQIMYLSAYNFAHTPCVSIVLLTYSFSTTCSDTSMASMYSWYQFLLCPPFSSSRFLHIYTYMRTSFSGPRRCVWGFRLSSFDARGPESL